jgi:competence protein ComEA
VASELNLAAVVDDGEHLYVPSRDDAVAGGPGGASPGSGSGGAAGGSLLDVNRATQAELEALPGIGPVTAQKIIAARTEAPFRTIDELRERGLLGQKTFDGLKALITVG